MAKRIESFFLKSARWGPESKRLRGILLDSGLTEQLKWSKPCYSYDDANVCILQPMKGFLALMFFKGALLKDPKGLLKEQGKNTRAARRLCFTSTDEVDKLDKALRGFVRKAITVEKKGLELPEAPELVLVEELQEALDADPKLRRAFLALTPGRQRGYHLQISAAKQSATRSRRVEQHRARILAGKGLRDA